MIERTISAYLNSLKKSGYSTGTLNTQKTVLNHFITYLNITGIQELKEIDMSVMEGYYAYLSQKSFKETTVKNHRKRIKAFFKYLLERKIIESNPFLRKKKEYPAEFEKYMREYLKMKEFENTCFNSMKKKKRSLSLFYDFLIEEGLAVHNSIKRDDLTGFVKYLIDLKNGKGEPLYQNTSVNRMLSDLKPYIQWLTRKGMFAPGFSDHLEYLRKTRRLSRNILTRKELAALFNIKTGSLYEFMMKTIFIVQYASGLRINELLSISMGDIDFENETLCIFETKTKKERIVHIGEVGARYLKIFIEEVRAKVCYDHLTEEHLFLSFCEGKKLNCNTVNRYLKKFCKKAGITKTVTCHCFRHSYGTHLLENGLGIKQVSDLMGHKDLVSTEQYTKLSPEHLRKTINLFHPLENESHAGS